MPLLDWPDNPPGIIQPAPAGIGYPGRIPPIRPPNPYGPPTVPMQGPIPPIRPPNPYGAPRGMPGDPYANVENPYPQYGKYRIKTLPGWLQNISPNGGGGNGGPSDNRPYSYPLGLEYFAHASNPNWQPTGAPSTNIENRTPTWKLGPYGRARTEAAWFRESPLAEAYWKRAGGPVAPSDLGAIAEQLLNLIADHQKEAKK